MIWLPSKTLASNHALQWILQVSVKPIDFSLCKYYPLLSVFPSVGWAKYIRSWTQTQYSPTQPGISHFDYQVIECRDLVVVRQYCGGGSVLTCTILSTHFSYQFDSSIVNCRSYLQRTIWVLAPKPLWLAALECFDLCNNLDILPSRLSPANCPWAFGAPAQRLLRALSVERTKYKVSMTVSTRRILSYNYILGQI